MKKKTLLNANWLEEDQFKSWLTSATNKARCRLSEKDIELSNMGRQALVSEVEVDVKVKIFFQAKEQTEKDSSKLSQLESEKPGTCSSKTQSSIELVINT